MSGYGDLFFKPTGGFSRCEVDGLVSLFKQIERIDCFEWYDDAGGAVATPIMHAAQGEDEEASVN